MFTGIVDHVGTIAARQGGEADGRMRLTIQTRFADLVIGESIAVDGACLTVIDPKENQFDCELSGETLQKTVSGGYEVGTVVNLERAMALGDRFGGHMVSGHVDGTVKVKSIEPQADFWKLTFHGVGDGFRSLLLDKGSIAIQGTSLTVNEVVDNGEAFHVMLIPHTLERTNLKTLTAGQRVNVEFDGFVKILKKQVEETVQKILSARKETP